jgi:opacity protein-like surface antigen
MRKLVVIAVLVLGFSVMAVAQDVPRAEFFGGYSYLRCDTQGGPSCNLNGWNGSVSINANKFVGVVADFSGHYGSVDSASVHAHSFLFGPKITVRREKFTPFLQALFGGTHVNVGDGVGTSENDFAMAFGGGLDINLSENVAVRPVQAEYLTIKSGSEFLKNFRYSGGIVFKLGKR